MDIHSLTGIHSLLVTVLSFAVAIGVLVFVHELGHFAVAKRAGVVVERFSIGFGPVILARKRGETEYAVSAIPLGGYVKMLGEEEGEDVLANPERAFSTQPVLRRAAIVFAGPAMNFVFAFLVYAILFAAVGVQVPSTKPRVGPLEAVGMAAEETGARAVMVLKGLQLMLTGRVPFRDLGGPIAIASVAGKQARAGARYYLLTLAFLSVNLGLLNLLPIPALDGGHLAFFAIEGAMRRPLRARHREIALQVGILLLITLIVFVSYNDIHRLVWG